MQNKLFDLGKSLSIRELEERYEYTIGSSFETMKDDTDINPRCDTDWLP